jgi:Laminin B (Domain IV)/IPT/TIG domain
MTRFRLFMISAILFIALTSNAQIVSNFNTDGEDWVAEHSGGTVAPTSYQSSNGNPGGFMNASPPTTGGSTNTSMTWYWLAPLKFLGKADWSYRAVMTFDLQQSVAGTDNSQSDIIIVGPSSKSIHLRFADKPAVSPAWRSYSIALDETAGWRNGSVGGTVALKFQIKEVLSNITAIYIRCKFINAVGYTSGIDNVALERRSVDVGPVITSFSPTEALPGETVTIKGTDFGGTLGETLYPSVMSKPPLHRQAAHK